MSKKVSRFLFIFSIVILVGFSLFVQESVSQSKKSFLWKVQSKTNTVYVLGSIHFLKKEMYPLDEKIENAFEQSDILVVEADINSIKNGDIQKMMEVASYSGNDTLEKNVSPDTLELLKKELMSLGLPLEAVNKKRPWFLAMTLASLEILKMGFDPNYGIDKYFLSKSTGKKKILELEGFDYQIDLFSKLSDKDQELFLLYTLKDLNIFKQELDGLIQAWTTGDTKSTESIITRSLEEDKRLFTIYEKLLYERNRNMTSKIEDYLETKEPYFVIVGAGHLVGSQGIIENLRKKGFLVEQL
jgi:uncharacterized protein YbaP (TraB family)